MMSRHRGDELRSPQQAPSHALPSHRCHASAAAPLSVHNVRQRQGNASNSEGRTIPPWREDAPAAIAAQLRHVPLPVNDGESSDDDSILAGIEETRIRLSRNIELLPPPLAHHNDNSAVAAAALLSSEYSSDDMAADEADLKYMCPLTQCFATEDPVVFQQQIYERAMLQTYFSNYDGGDINIPHPVHRTLVARTLFELALSSRVSSSSLQCKAQEAALSYESRVERRDVYNRCQ
jgi:hypothetical protein